MQNFELKFSWVTVLQGGVEFWIFLLILAWTLQQCSANALSVIGNFGLGGLFVLSRVQRSLHQKLITFTVVCKAL